MVKAVFIAAYAIVQANCPTTNRQIIQQEITTTEETKGPFPSPSTLAHQTLLSLIAKGHCGPRA